MLSGFSENCNSGFGINRITYTDTCTVSGQDLKIHHNMDSINVSYYILFLFCFCSIFAPYILTEHILQDLVVSGRSNPNGQTDLIVFCSGGFEKLEKSEG